MEASAIQEVNDEGPAINIAMTHVIMLPHIWQLTLFSQEGNYQNMMTMRLIISSRMIADLLVSVMM